MATEREKDDRKAAIDEFKEAVNMPAGTLEAWLQTDESNAVGQKDNGGESTGHESGRTIVAILRKKQNEYTDADITHMRKVTGYIHRHLAQRPNGDVSETNWAYSLKNWGHDPNK